MSSPTDETDPNFKTKAKEAARKADPWADRALYAIQGSEYSAVIIGAIVVGLILFGVWVSR